MEVYPKIPGTRISPVGGQPPGRSCSESPWGQGSYRPMGVAGIIFSLFVVAASHGRLFDNRSQRTEWFVVCGEITGCRVWLLLFSLLVVATPAMKVYPKIPGTRVSSAGSQPSGRLSPVSPWGQGSYRPKGVAGIVFSWFVVTQAMRVYPKIPGTRLSSVGAQPSGRSCAESPWGQGSYRPQGLPVSDFHGLLWHPGHACLSENPRNPVF